MPGYWCIECQLPAVGPLDAAGRDGFSCWGCSGPVVSDIQLAYWNNLAFRAALNKRLAQLRAGETLELAGHPGALFAIGAAADLLLAEALGRPG